MVALIALLGLRQEDFEFKVDFGSTMRLSLKRRKRLTTYISVL